MKLKGVNLGGYLVLEKWITPNLFQDTAATDEFTLHSLRSPDLSEKLKKHYEGFITEDDLIFLKLHGVNALRVPVGHFLFGDAPPYPATYMYLDTLMALCNKHNLCVILDMHTAPGSQNGWDHSGQAGNIGWHKKQDNITNTLSVVSKVAHRYGRLPNLYGIELLNEPHFDIPMRVLKEFYTKGFEAVREYSNCAVVIHDAFRPLKWTDFMIKKSHVVLDMHLYQCFSQKDKEMSMQEHIEYTKKEWGRLIEIVQKNRQAIVGEWSLGIDFLSLKGLTKPEVKARTKDYALTQLQTFSPLLGHFFWNYKTADIGGWNYVHCIQTGMLPSY